MRSAKDDRVSQDACSEKFTRVSGTNISSQKLRPLGQDPIAMASSSLLSVSDDGSDVAASVVYVTLPQSFSGSAMYSTLTRDYYPEATEAPTSIVGNVPELYSGLASSRSGYMSTHSTAAESSSAGATSSVLPQSSAQRA